MDERLRDKAEAVFIQIRTQTSILLACWHEVSQQELEVATASMAALVLRAATLANGHDDDPDDSDWDEDDPYDGYHEDESLPPPPE